MHEDQPSVSWITRLSSVHSARYFIGNKGIYFGNAFSKCGYAEMVDFIYVGDIGFYILRYLLRRGILRNRSWRIAPICISFINIVLLYIRPVDLIEHRVYSFFAFVSLLLALHKTRMPKFVNKFGDSSYSFYLIHYYIIIVVDKIANIHAFSLSAILGSVVVITISSAMAFVSYRRVECKLGDWMKCALVRTNA